MPYWRGKSILHLGVRWIMLATAVQFAFYAHPLFANPAGASVVNGAVNMQTSGNTLAITASDRSIINWQGFSIGAGETTHFIQPNASASVLNRVTSGDASQIMGALQANGQVYLINPNGVFIGNGATINVGSFLASTANVTDESFMRGGNLTFSEASGAGIINRGTITASHGDVFLLARTVENSGTIQAAQGTVGLMAGTQFFLKKDETGAVKVKVDSSSVLGVKAGTGVANSGVIEAMQAQLEAQGNVYALAINQSGIIRATGVSRDASGTIVLSAPGGMIRNTGTMLAINRDGSGGRLSISGQDVSLSDLSILTAAGTGGSEDAVGGQIEIAAVEDAIVAGRLDVTAGGSAKGGRMVVTGRRVGVFGGKLDASGGAGGGEILLGGDYQGMNPLVRNAEAMVMSSDSSIAADATVAGDGGRVILWSNEYTGFYGDISAKGGVVSGNGGFVETSSKDNLQAFGTVIASAMSGSAGLWLLDPYNVTINSSVSANVTGSPTFTTTGSPANIQASSINTSLSAGTSVTVSTGNTSGSQDGNITVDATGVITKITTSADSTLTLNANGSITINAAISGTSALGRLIVVLNAGSPNNGDTTTLSAAAVNINAPITTIGGGITINSNGSGGTILANGIALTTGALNRAATGTATGRSSGDVTINQTGTGSVTLSGSVNTSVSSTTQASAGSAGDVTITTANGLITVGSITAVGGNGAAGVAGDTFNGGTGGAISLTAGNSNSITLSGSTFNTTGGAAGTSTGGTAGAGGNVTLGSQVSLSGGSVSITTGATAGNIAFNSTLDGAQTLGLTSGTGNITFGGAVGSTIPLGAVTLNAATAVTASAAFRAASLNQATASTGLTSFQSITTTPLTLGAGGSVSLASSLTGGPAVTVTGLIDTRGNNTGGVGQAGGSVTITTSGTSGTMSIGSINTSGGTALVSGAGGTGGNTVLTATGSSGTITVGAINTSGGAALTSGAGGNAGAIILDTQSRNITLNGSLTTSGGNGIGAAGGFGTSLVFNDPVVLGGASTMNTSGGTGSTAGASGNVSFNSTLNGSGALTITISTIPTLGLYNGGNISFAAAVGGTTPLGTVIINNSSALGTVQVGSVSATSTSFQAASLDLTSSSLTLFATTIQTSGVAGVTLNTTAVTLNGSTSGNLTTIDTTNGGAVAAGANITVNGTVNGALAPAGSQSLTLNSGTGGVITFGTSLLPISIGATRALSALTITQSGGATFSGAVSAATVTITDTADTKTVAFQGNLTAATGMTIAPNGAYNVSITGTANAIAGETIFNNTGTVTLGDGGDTIGFTGGVVATAPLLGKNVNGTITAAGIGVINLGTTGVTVEGTSIVGGTSIGAITLGNATLANGVTLTVGTGIANAITLGSVTGTASGAVSNLTVTSTGAVILNGAIGTNIGAVSVNSNPSSLNVNSTITGSGAIILTAGAGGITTATDATISSTASSVSLTTSAGGNINLNSPINTVGGTTVTLNSAGVLNIGVAGDITSDGAVSLNLTGGGIQTAGSVATSADAVTFSSATTLTGTVDVNTGSTGGNITFSSTLTGAGQNLNLTAGTAGNVLFSGTVGAARLGAITINSALDVTAAAITAASFVQTAGQGTTTFGGAQNYNTSTGLSVVTDTIALSQAVTTTAGGIVTLNANNLGGVAAGTMTIAAAGDIISEGAVNLTGASGISTAGDVTTTGDLVNYNSATTLTGNVLVDTTSAGGSPAGATVTFGSTLDGGFTLGLTAGTAGNVVFTGLVGNTTPVGALTVSRAVNVEANGIRAASFTQTTGSGTTTLNSGDFTTGTDAALSVTGAAAASVANGVVTLNGLLLSTSGAGAVILNALTGGLTLGGAITSAGGATLTGANGLTQSAAISSTGVGANVAMTATTGTLSIGAGVGTAAGGAVTVNAAAGALTITAAGDITSGGVVNLTGFTGISTAGDVTTTADLVNYNSATTLTGNVLVDTTSAGGSPAGATITFLNKLDGANTLGLTAGTAGNVVFTGLVGDTTALGAVTISSAATVTANGIRATSFVQTTGSGTTTLNLGNFTTGTAQAVGTTAIGGISVSNDAVVVNNRLDTAAGGIVSLTSEVGALTIASAGDITSDGAVNLTGATGISTAGDVTTAADLVNYNSATTLTGGILVNTTSGSAGGATITFLNKLDGANTLGLTAGTAGNVVFTGAVGGGVGTRLGAITINSANNFTAAAITAASLVQTIGQGTTTFNGAQNYNAVAGLNVVTDTISLQNTVTTTTGSTGAIVTLNANNLGGAAAGTLTIGALGDITSDGAVNLTGASGISTGGDVTTTGDVVNYNSATTLTGGILVNTTSGSATGATITFNNLLNGTAGTETLGLTAGTAGNVVFTGAVGTTRLGAVTVVSGQNLTESAGFRAATLDLTGLTGTASFPGTGGTGILDLSTGLTVGGGAKNISITGGTTATPNTIAGLTIFDNTGNLTIGSTATDATLFVGGLTATLPAFGAGFVRTAGGAVSLGEVTLTAATTIDTTNNGAVAAGANLTLAKALGGQNLTLVGGTGGVVTLTAATVANLTVTAGGGTTGDIVLGPVVNSVNATGDILLQGATAATTIDVGLLTGGTGLLGITDTDLDAIASGATLLTIGQAAQSGTITVGDSAFKTSVSIQATSGLVQVTGNVTNPGKSVELKGGNVTLAVTKNITTTAATGTASGNVDIISTGAGTINLAGNIITSGANNAAGGNVSVTAAANISVSGGGVNTSGGTSTGVGRAAGTVTLNSTGGAVSLGAVTAAGSAAAVASGLAGGAGGAVTVSSSGNTTLTGATIDTSGGAGDGVGAQGAGGNVLFNNNLVLSGSETITTGVGAGNITFSVTLNGTAAQAQDLTLTAGTGDITFSQLVGDGTALGAVVINSAQTVLASFGFTAKSLTQSAGTGSTTFNGITTTGLADAVGGDVNLTTAGNISVAGGTVTTSGGTAAAAGRNAGNLTLNSTGGTVSLGAVTATGSAAATTGLDGGAGGAVGVSSFGNTLLTGATINMSGGAGVGAGVQGTGGTVLFNNNVVSPANITIIGANTLTSMANVTFAGDLTAKANNMFFNGTEVRSTGGGTITLAPTTLGNGILVTGTTPSVPPANTLVLDNLDSIYTSGLLVIGSATSGVITIGGTVDLSNTGYTGFSLLSGDATATFNANSVLTLPTATDILFDLGTGDVNGVAELNQLYTASFSPSLVSEGGTLSFAVGSVSLYGSVGNLEISDSSGPAGGLVYLNEGTLNVIGSQTAAGEMLIESVNGDLNLSSQLTATKITAYAGQNFNNTFGSTAINLLGGRGLVYSTNPDDNTPNTANGGLTGFGAAYLVPTPDFDFTGVGTYTIANAPAGNANLMAYSDPIPVSQLDSVTLNQIVQTDAYLAAVPLTGASLPALPRSAVRLGFRTGGPQQRAAAVAPLGQVDKNVDTKGQSAEVTAPGRLKVSQMKKGNGNNSLEQASNKQPVIRIGVVSLRSSGEYLPFELAEVTMGGIRISQK